MNIYSDIRPRTPKRTPAQYVELILGSDIIRPKTRRALLAALEYARAEGRERPTIDDCRRAAKLNRTRLASIAKGWGWLTCSRCRTVMDAAVESVNLPPQWCLHRDDLGHDPEPLACLLLFGFTVAPDGVLANYSFPRPGQRLG